jgi:hypothetical protein
MSTEHAPPPTSSKSMNVAALCSGLLAQRNQRHDAALRAHRHPRRFNAILHAALRCLDGKKTQNRPNPRSYEGTYEERPGPQTPELMKELMNFITSPSLFRAGKSKQTKKKSKRGRGAELAGSLTGK